MTHDTDEVCAVCLEKLTWTEDPTGVVGWYCTNKDCDQYKYEEEREEEYVRKHDQRRALEEIGRLAREINRRISSQQSRGTLFDAYGRMVSVGRGEYE